MGLRAWATPLTIASFAIMAVTGLLMFLRLDMGAHKPLHEWAGLVFVAAVTLHLALNWRPFRLHLRRTLPRALIALALAALVIASLLPRAPRRRETAARIAVPPR